MTSFPSIGQVELNTQAEVEVWLAKCNWPEAREELKLLTLGRGGRQLRGWKGCFNHFGGWEGGHFDSNKDKLFDLLCGDAKIAAYVLRRIKMATRRKFVHFVASPQTPPEYGVKEPCEIIVPFGR